MASKWLYDYGIVMFHYHLAVVIKSRTHNRTYTISQRKNARIITQSPKVTLDQFDIIIIHSPPVAVRTFCS